MTGQRRLLAPMRARVEDASANSRPPHGSARLPAEAARQGVKLRQSLLGAAVAGIRLCVVVGRQPIARVGPGPAVVDAVFAFISQLLAFVSLAFADLRANLTLVRQALAEC